MATIEEVLTQASVRDFGHVGDRFTAATAEAADLETRWATLRGLAPDSRLPDAVIGLIGSIDSLVAAAEVRHATLGTWARSQRLALHAEAVRLLGEEGPVVIPTQWTPL
jgi:hypothetical protein